MDRLTIQDSLMYEGLRVHSKGPNLRACGVSLIRNVIANNIVRNPNNTCGFAGTGASPRNGGGPTGENEFRNNLVFNATQGFLDYWNGRGGSEVNIVGNVFLKGPLTPAGKTAPYAVDARDIASKMQDDGLQPGRPAIPRRAPRTRRSFAFRTTSRTCRARLGRSRSMACSIRATRTSWLRRTATRTRSATPMRLAASAA